MKIIKKFFKILIIASTCIIAAAAAGCNVPSGENPPAEPTVSVKSYGGYEESLYAVWEENSPQNAKVYYKEKTANNSGWVQVDSPLIRNDGKGLARVDAVGLKAGEYNLKIVSSNGAQTVLKNTINVSAYDRSGYAHFQRNDEEAAAYDGVGAYKDDGTIKKNTLIVYVTEENKNDIRDSVYLNGEKIDVSGYFRRDNYSIGYFLNGSVSAINNLNIDYPAISVRFIGKVNAEDATDCTNSLIDGLSPYITDEGKENNGRMAQIVDCKNITLEGVGTDAEIFGWGFAFYAKNKSINKNNGTSFEVRNLTFRNYPEDAIGMEGNKKLNDSGEETLACPVERCWIHNNTFYKGYCKIPTEDDKGDGDGTVDFKRGQYYTLSYNYFEKTNKTCLVGSSAATLQYNVTMHHNWWNNCIVRKPLLRRANVHYYNNYITEDTYTSHVVTLRAYCYMFMEANYFESCKDIALDQGEVEEGGINAAKAYNNFYGIIMGHDVSIKVTSRTEYVENQCAYEAGGIDYTKFDINSTLFYYDEENQRSNCLLDTAEQAKINVMLYAGVHGFGSRAE